MPQHLVPNADISNQNWIPTTLLWSPIAQEAGSIVTTNINTPPGAIGFVHLSDGVDPGRHDGHVFVVEVKGEYDNPFQPDINDLYLTLSLRQGASAIMTTIEFVDPSEDDWTRVDLVLSASEAAAISDYSDLRVHMIAGYVGSTEVEGEL